MSVELTGASCAIHTLNRAQGTCARCGIFTCDTCETNPFFRGHCPRCIGRLAGKASSRAITALVFAGLSIGCYCLPLGIVAIVLGNSEISAIDRGESPESGRSYAQAARIIGWVGTGILAIVIVIFGVGMLVEATGG